MNTLQKRKGKKRKQKTCCPTSATCSCPDFQGHQVVMRIPDPTQILADTVSNKARYGTRGFSSLPSMAEPNPLAPHREPEFQTPTWRFKKKRKKEKLPYPLCWESVRRDLGASILGLIIGDHARKGQGRAALSASAVKMEVLLGSSWFPPLPWKISRISPLGDHRGLMEKLDWLPLGRK